MAYSSSKARKRRRLMATESCEVRKRVRTKCKVDRFSDLPEEVAHYILSFLTIRDLTRFSIASKRCRELYLSTPSLVFDKFSPNQIWCNDNHLRLLDSLDRFFILRGGNKIHKFLYGSRALVPCLRQNEIVRIMTWVESALRCDVEVLELNVANRLESVPMFVFPSCVLQSRSLRSLSLTMYSTIIKAPSFPCSSSLEYLNLHNVDIDEGFFKWISLSCKCIKELHISHVGGELRDITIESSSLKSFTVHYVHKLLNLKISGEKLQDIHIHWFYNHPYTSLNIFAPNLKYLEWSGRPVSHQLGELLRLEKAKIDLYCKEDHSDRVYEVLRNICRVKVLILYEDTIKALHLGGFMAPPFEDVSNLEIKIGCFTDELVPAMVCLLRGMTNMRSLHLKSDPFFNYYVKADCSRFDRGYWKSQDLPFISQLEEVTIMFSKDSRGSNPIEFSRFILEHAKNLKKVLIVHSSRLAKLSLQKLNRSAKTSNAEVIFHCKAKRSREEQLARFS